MTVPTELLKRSNTNPKKERGANPTLEEGGLEEGPKRGRQCLTMILEDELKENPPKCTEKEGRRATLHKGSGYTGAPMPQTA